MPLTPKQEAFARSYVETGNAFDACVEAGFVANSRPPKIGSYVYILVRPDTEQIIYIGKGTGRRMFSHVKEAMAGKISGLKKYNGIKQLIDAGITPVPYCIIKDLPPLSATYIERHLIAKIGLDMLLNSASGQRNGLELSLAKMEWLSASIKTFDQWAAGGRNRTKEFYDAFLLEVQEQKDWINQLIAEKRGINGQA